MLLFLFLLPLLTKPIHAQFPTFICVQGLYTTPLLDSANARLGNNFYYFATTNLWTVTGAQSTTAARITNVTVNGTSSWGILWFSTLLASWDKYSASDPVADANLQNNTIMIYPSSVSPGIPAADPLIGEDCYGSVRNVTADTFCLRGVRDANLFEVNGGFSFAGVTTFGVSSYFPDASLITSRGSYSFTYTPTTSTSYPYWSFGNGQLILPFFFADLYRNLNLPGLPIFFAGGIQTSGFTATNGSCIPLGPSDVNITNTCEFIVLPYVESIQYLDTNYPFSEIAPLLNQTVDYLEWFYPMYTFGDLARGFVNNFTNITVDVMAELQVIRATPWTNAVEPFYALNALYSRLYDAHTAYIPSSIFRLVTYYQVFITMQLAVNGNEFALFGRPSSAWLAEYERVIGPLNLTLIDTLSYWKIMTIDGLPAIDVVQAYADNYYGLSHDAGTRVQTMLVSGAFSIRRFPPKSMSMTFEVCNPASCASTTKILVIQWLALVKLNCNQITSSPTKSPTKGPTPPGATTTISPTAGPVPAPPACNITYNGNAQVGSQFVDDIGGVFDDVEENGKEEEEEYVGDSWMMTHFVNKRKRQSSSSDAEARNKDPFALKQHDLKEMRMGIEEFQKKRSSLRDKYEVRHFEHHDIEKIAGERRVMPHEYHVLENPVELTPEFHRDSRQRGRLMAKKEDLEHLKKEEEESTSSSSRRRSLLPTNSILYTPLNTISYHVDTNNSVVIIAINTFSPSSSATFRTEIDFVIRNFLYDNGTTGAVTNGNKLVFDFTENGGGSICLGYGFIDYLLGGLGWPFIMDTVPNDMPAGATYRYVAQVAADWIANAEATGDCSGNGCQFLDQLAYCNWNYTTADWMTGGPTVTRTSLNIPRQLSQRLSWSTICGYEKALWPVPPGGAGVNVLNGNNLLMISDGFCGSMCAIVSSWLNVNGYGQYATYNGLWQSGPPAGEPIPLPQVFNSFPGGQVRNSDNIWPALLGGYASNTQNGFRWFSTVANNDTFFGPFARYMPNTIVGIFTWNFLELYIPSLNPQPNFQGTLPLEFLDELRVSDRFRTAFTLTDIQAGSTTATGNAIRNLYMQWLANMTMSPSMTPSSQPSVSPSMNPSMSPSMGPSMGPSANPSMGPSMSPSMNPSMNPSVGPSKSPSMGPSMGPSASPSMGPSMSPSMGPSMGPSMNPTLSLSPTSNPTLSPSMNPSMNPSGSPTKGPSTGPSMSPSGNPTMTPSVMPSKSPSLTPTGSPSSSPSTSPSKNPSTTPTTSNPTTTPTKPPSKSPTKMPSVTPTSAPFAQTNAVTVSQDIRMTSTVSATTLRTNVTLLRGVQGALNEETCGANKKIAGLTCQLRVTSVGGVNVTIPMGMPRRLLQNTTTYTYIIGTLITAPNGSNAGVAELQQQLASNSTVLAQVGRALGMALGVNVTVDVPPTMTPPPDGVGGGAVGLMGGWAGMLGLSVWVTVVGAWML